MSKKHFEALANMVQNLPLGRGDRLRVALSLADLCLGFNSAFDRDRFMEACGFKNGKEV